MMKRILLLSVLTVGLLNYSLSQSGGESDFHRHEFNLEINDGLPIQFFYAFRSVGEALFVGPFSQQAKVEEKTRSTPYISASYNYYIKPWFAIGADAGFHLRNSKKTYRHKSTGELSYVSSKSNIASLAVNMKFIYVSKPYFQFYGRVLAGGMWYGEKVEREKGNELIKADPYNQISFTGQVMPLGFRFGGQLAGFVELGFGVKGVVGAGISYKF